jgi:hypothetical protein
MRRSALLLASSLIAAALAGCSGMRTSADSGAACLAGLARAGVEYQSVDVADPHNDRCVVDTAVRVRRLAVGFNRPATMSCALGSHLNQFEREVVQPLAVSDLGSRVSRIDHLGAYACRANTGVRGRLSEHAFGRAIDIAGFRLANGTVVNVERDWSRPGPNRTFLHDVARNACRYFSVVLTPDSNADHYNHFHFDIGPGKSCPDS